MLPRNSVRLLLPLLATSALLAASLTSADDKSTFDPVAEAQKALARMDVKPGDSPTMGITSLRNNVTTAKNIPTDWDTSSGKNVKW
jgi:hypothetical protein